MELRLSRKVFNEAYYPMLFDYSHRYEVLYGGSGSGKSVFITQKLILKCLNDKRRVLVVRKTMSSQRESCWRLFLDILSKWKIYSYCDVRKSDFTITFPNGSQCLFKGLDDSEKIKSIAGITDCWCEECTELLEDDFDQLDLRMRDKAENQQIFVSFNPISKANWVYKRWFDSDSIIDDQTYILKTTYKDNKFLPEIYIQQLENKINTNPTYYKIYALGEFCSLDKLVYNNWRVEDFDYLDIKGAELVCGLDFGFSSDPNAFICLLVKDKKIYLFKEWVERGKVNTEIYNAIKSLGFSKSTIIADSADPKSIEDLRRMGLTRIKPAIKGPDSIRIGIQKIQEYEIIVHPSCIETITEFENYSWKKDKKTNEYINEPIDDFNHCMDAFRYAMSIIFKNNRLKSIDKSILGL